MGNHEDGYLIGVNNLISIFVTMLEQQPIAVTPPLTLPDPPDQKEQQERGKDETWAVCYSYCSCFLSDWFHPVSSLYLQTFTIYCFFFNLCIFWTHKYRNVLNIFICIFFNTYNVTQSMHWEEMYLYLENTLILRTLYRWYIKIIILHLNIVSFCIYYVVFCSITCSFKKMQENG